MADCPVCGQPSGGVHSRYHRTLADLPAGGRRVVLRLTARRFFCRQPGCPRAVFCERLGGLAAPHARASGRLAEAHRGLGLALGGEAGGRLAAGLGMPTSPDTVLRRVKGCEDAPAPAPRFVGLDDWAWRKGHRYGTIVVDLERGCVIDLLPDREAATVGRWLAEHPGVELISRDRWAAYGQAAAAAAPAVAQVADRWHLLKNLREAVERLVERHGGAVATALPEAAATAAPAGGAAVEPRSATQAARQARRRRRAEQFEQVRGLHRQGGSSRRIAAALGLSRTTVLRYLRRPARPDWRPGRWRRSALDAERDWVDQRIREGAPTPRPSTANCGPGVAAWAPRRSGSSSAGGSRPRPCRGGRPPRRSLNRLPRRRRGSCPSRGSAVPRSGPAGSRRGWRRSGRRREHWPKGWRWRTGSPR